MSFLHSSLDSLGLEYFTSGDHTLLVFRGEVLDHSILIRQGESFIYLTCVIGRAPELFLQELAVRLLEWNASHTLARAAVSDDRLVILAEMPLQGLQAEGVETVILSVATAAEELAPAVLPLLLAGPGAAEPVAATAEPPPPPVHESPDSEIDWEAADT